MLHFQLSGFQLKLGSLWWQLCACQSFSDECLSMWKDVLFSLRLKQQSRDHHKHTHKTVCTHCEERQWQISTDDIWVIASFRLKNMHKSLLTSWENSLRFCIRASSFGFLHYKWIIYEPMSSLSRSLYCSWCQLVSWSSGQCLQRNKFVI